MILVAHVTVINPATRETSVLRVTSGKHFIHEGYQYAPYLQAGFTYEQTLYSKGTTSGEVSVSYGNLRIDNINGWLDYLRVYGIGGHPCEIFVLEDENDELTDANLYFTGVSYFPQLSVEELNITVMSRMQELEVPCIDATFLGTNEGPDGLEGLEETIKAKQKPVLYGIAFNVAPPLINDSLLIYGCNFKKNGDRKPISKIERVLDAGGVLLFESDHATSTALQASAVTDGYYQTCLAEGLFKLGTAPVGEVTVDVYESDGENASAPRVIRRMLEDLMGYEAGVDFHSGDLEALHEKNSHAVGVYINDTETVFSAFVAVLDSIGGWASPDAKGMFRFGRLDDPEDSPYEGTITQDMYLDDSLNRVPTNDEGRNIPAYKVELQHTKNWSVLGKKDILESITDTVERARLSTEYRSVMTEDETDTVKTIHPQATYLTYTTLLTGPLYTDEPRTGLTPQEEADRIFAMQSRTQERYTLEVDFNQFKHTRMGSCLRLESDRFFLSEGKKLTVLGRKDNLETEVIELDLYGINQY